MASEGTNPLEIVFGQQARMYSTFDFGRGKDPRCMSVVVGEEEARAQLPTLREKLGPGYIAFIGTTRWLGDEKHKGVEVVVAQGTPPFDILRTARSDACNYGLGTEDLVNKLQSWHDAVGIDIFQAETDTIQLCLVKLPQDLSAFAKDVYDFCPDIVDQGVGTIESLEQSIREHKQVYLWWD